MFLRQVVAGLLLISISNPATPCDVCGTTGAANQFGILSGSNRHFLGAKYRSKLYKSVHPSLFSNVSDRIYSTRVDEFNLNGRWVAADRVHMYGNISYLNTHDLQARISGISDLSLRLNYALIKHSDTTTNAIVKHGFWINAGSELPTGQLQQSNEASDLYSTMSPGSGTFDFLAGMQYHLKINNFGLSAESAFKINGTNYYRYKFGNSLSSALQVFRTFELKSIDKAIIPQLGINHLYAQKDKLNASKGEMNPYSGGHILSSQLRVDAMFNSISFYLGFQLPIWQDYANGLLTKKHELLAGINWYIN